MSENGKNGEKVIAPRTRLAREKVKFVYNLLIRSDYEGALRRDVGHILGPSALSPVRDKFFPITSDDLLAEDQGRCSCFVGIDFSTPLQSLVKGRKVTKSRAATRGKRAVTRTSPEGLNMYIFILPHQLDGSVWLCVC